MKLDQLFGSLGSQIVSGALTLLVCFVPLFVLMRIAHFRRKRFKADYLEPFTEMPLRPPGESLRMKIESMGDELESSLLALMATSFFTFVLLVFLPIARSGFVWLTLALALVISYTIYAPKLFHQIKQLWDYRLGLKGECAVGQELNQLVADGFQVFHDLPFENFNIDHVIIGHAGVWAVETKTRRKPASIKGAAKALVTYDGETLQFPWGNDRFGLDQAERNAATLSKWLTASTGDFTPVAAMLVLPGWWVERKARGNVTLLNPKEVRRAFPLRPTNPLSPDRVQRIAFQLTERCRMERRSQN